MALDESERAEQLVERLEQRLRKEAKASQAGDATPIRFDDPEPDARHALVADLRLELGVHYAEHKPAAFQAEYWERALRSPHVSRSLGHRIRAEVKLAQARWQQSCPIPQDDGLCVRWRPYRAPTTGGPRCEPWTKLDQPQVLRRDARLVAAAMQAVRRALAPYPVALVLEQRRGHEPNAHLGNSAVVEAVESALLLQADERYERFLALAVPPEGILPNGRPDRTYARWWKSRIEAMEAVRSRHSTLLALSDGLAGQAAAARLMQVTLLFIAGLQWLPLPSPPAPPESMSQSEWSRQFAASYCNSLDSRDAARPMWERHVACVERARNLGVGTHWLSQCERAADVIGGREWPMPAEIHLSPVHMALPLDRADVQTVTTKKP